jgi:hypothetical protein
LFLVIGGSGALTISSGSSASTGDLAVAEIRDDHEVAGREMVAILELRDEREGTRGLVLLDSLLADIHVRAGVAVDVMASIDDNGTIRVQALYQDSVRAVVGRRRVEDTEFVRAASNERRVDTTKVRGAVLALAARISDEVLATSEEKTALHALPRASPRLVVLVEIDLEVAADDHDLVRPELLLDVLDGLEAGKHILGDDGVLGTARDLVLDRGDTEVADRENLPIHEILQRDLGAEDDLGVVRTSVDLETDRVELQEVPECRESQRPRNVLLVDDEGTELLRVSRSRTTDRGDERLDVGGTGVAEALEGDDCRSRGGERLANPGTTTPEGRVLHGLRDSTDIKVPIGHDDICRSTSTNSGGRFNIRSHSC